MFYFVFSAHSINMFQEEIQEVAYLENNAPRQTCLVTYIQFDNRKFPTR